MYKTGTRLNKPPLNWHWEPDESQYWKDTMDPCLASPGTNLQVHVLDWTPLLQTPEDGLFIICKKCCRTSCVYNLKMNLGCYSVITKTFCHTLNSFRFKTGSPASWQIHQKICALGIVWPQRCLRVWKYYKNYKNGSNAKLVCNYTVERNTGIFSLFVFVFAFCQHFQHCPCGIYESLLWSFPFLALL